MERLFFSKKFNPAKDRIFLVFSTYTKEVKNHFKEMRNWAKVKATPDHFYTDVSRIVKKKYYYDLLKKIITKVQPLVTDEEVFKFCSCFELLADDLKSDASVTKNTFLTFLQLATTIHSPAPKILWNEILSMLSNSRSKGGAYDATNIPPNLLSAIDKSYLHPIQQKLLRISAQCSTVTCDGHDKD